MGGAMGESDKTPRCSAKKKARCAIYTRKSSEEGLEQAFNSLDAQREACAAFILSQKHEGWTVLPALYDDGGFSGGTMERPALKRLITDIEAGQIDVVVVYKVDRLTRALSDFAKLVEVFDRRGVSFVSITQQFNTTTSMGRLTLNVLLSFAQFEREVTGERIRDKIAASKKKGMWMGGMPDPLTPVPFTGRPVTFIGTGPISSAKSVPFKTGARGPAHPRRSGHGTAASTPAAAMPCTKRRRGLFPARVLREIIVHLPRA